jgi:hypothetical protein
MALNSRAKPCKLAVWVRISFVFLKQRGSIGVLSPFRFAFQRRFGPTARTLAWIGVVILIEGCAAGRVAAVPSVEDPGQTNGEPSKAPGPRVAVAVFEDDRPPGEKDPAARIEAGDVLYPYYTYDSERERVSFRCGFLGACSAFRRVIRRITEETAKRFLQTAVSEGAFPPDSRFIPGPPDWPSERFRKLSGEGFKYLVTGKLERLYGMAYHPVEPLRAFLSFRLTNAGGESEISTPVNQVYALTRLEIRVIDLGKAAVVWEGPVEGSVDRNDPILLAREAADESLRDAIFEFLNKYNELVANPRS